MTRDPQSSKGLETKLAIIEAVIAVGKRKGVTAMSVRDICAETGISRQTFYRHFLDKYDALNWFNQRQFEEIANHVGKDMLWHDAALCMLVHTYDNRDFYSVALSEDEDVNSPMRTISRHLHVSWRQTISSYGDGTLTEELDYQMGAWSKLAPLLVAEWVSSGCPTSVDRFYALMESCMPRDIAAAMDNHVLAARS